MNIDDYFEQQGSGSPIVSIHLVGHSYGGVVALEQCA
ncbi:MAG: alpha/beta hydrolase [Gammaproteobacteria bacterium]|nr:alpha/beta hydrolase [Gammaproteobacteria bacterium]